MISATIKLTSLHLWGPPDPAHATAILFQFVFTEVPPRYHTETTSNVSISGPHLRVEPIGSTTHAQGVKSDIIFGASLSEHSSRDTGSGFIYNYVYYYLYVCGVIISMSKELNFKSRTWVMVVKHVYVQL